MPGTSDIPPPGTAVPSSAAPDPDGVSSGYAGAPGTGDKSAAEVAAERTGPLPLDAGRRSRHWRTAKYVFGVVLAGVAIYVISGRTQELSGATAYFAHLRWAWLGLAVLAETTSVLALASLQRRLIWAGDLDIGMRSLTGITLAGTAIQNSLPGGVVLSAVFSYRQFRLRGADELLAGWVLVSMTVISDVVLVFLAAGGLGLAASTGSAFDLVGVIVGLVVIAVVVVIAWTRRAWLIERAALPLGLMQRLIRRPKGNPQEIVDRLVERLGGLNPTRKDWMWAASSALANWIGDLACLAIAFLAVGAPIPWQGLLLAYTAGQVAANLPITPGGLGVVEGSLLLALEVFQSGKGTGAAVLIYRIINFWLQLPIGWACWVGVTRGGRRGRSAPQGLAGRRGRTLLSRTQRVPETEASAAVSDQGLGQ